MKTRAKSRTIVVKDKKGEKRFYAKKSKKGPSIKLVYVEDYKPPKKGCRIT